MTTMPFAVSAMHYLEAGWSPIPLPYKEKWPPPDGYTGAAGEFVDGARLKLWLMPRARVNSGKLNYPPGNVALRLPRGVLGIDVDAYGTKAGEATLARAEEEWGALPPTWVATSRTDGVSGIRLFRIPEGLAWPGELPTGKGVELIRWDHRFAIVSPSIHDKTGETYKWFTQDGVAMTEYPDAIPVIEDLAWLPDEWVEAMTGGVRWKERAADDSMGATDVRDWLAARVAPDSPCATMRSTLTRYQRAIRQAGDDGGAHDSARDGAWALIGDSGAGHAGIHSALNKLRKVFLVAVAERRGSGKDGERLAKEEWARIVVRGVQKVSAEGEPEEVDSCGSLVAPTKKASKGSDAIVWDLTEFGLATRLVRVMDNRARFVKEMGTGSWILWGGEKWKVDANGQVERWAWKAIDTIAEDIGHLEGDGDEKLLKAFRAHEKSSRSQARVRAAIGLAKDRKGMVVPEEELDGNPELLNCPNGTLVLGESAVEFRKAHRPEDYCTLSTGTKYVPEAKSKLWDGFLEKFLPDEEIRAWVQILVGYSLYGANPNRILVAVVGKTSTGKTTFGETLRKALGGYAAPMTASVLRDNQDDKPRPDLLKVLPKRLVIAEELSAAQHLHPDQIKRLTGGGAISARRMRSDIYQEVMPAFTPWLITNATPTIEGGDDALKRRLVVVPFDVQIPEGKEDGSYRKRMLKEGKEAILAWAVRGYEIWKENEAALTQVPLGALEANLKFAAEMSDFNGFLAEVCDRGDEYAEIPSRLYQAYEIWCDRNGIKERDRLSGVKFGRQLGGLNIDKRKMSVEGKQIWHRAGIRLVDGWDSIDAAR